MIEDVLREFLRFLMSHIGSEPLSIQTNLIHTDKTDGGEMVIEGAEISLGVRIQALVEKLGDNGSLGLE
jgi:hypothetical protein